MNPVVLPTELMFCMFCKSYTNISTFLHMHQRAASFLHGYVSMVMGEHINTFPIAVSGVRRHWCERTQAWWAGDDALFKTLHSTLKQWKKAKIRPPLLLVSIKHTRLLLFIWAERSFQKTNESNPPAWRVSNIDLKVNIYQVKYAQYCAFISKI